MNIVPQYLKAFVLLIYFGSALFRTNLDKEVFILVFTIKNIARTFLWFLFTIADQIMIPKFKGTNKNQ